MGVTCIVCKGRNTDETKSYCKPCKSEKDKEYYKRNRKWIQLRAIEYYWANRDVAQDRVRAYSKKNRDKCNALAAKRRAMKRMAIPSWYTKEEGRAISKLYRIALEGKERSGIPYVVDHIIPLQGKTVCGLHTIWNLRVITASDNGAKSNRLIEELL